MNVSKLYLCTYVQLHRFDLPPLGSVVRALRQTGAGFGARSPLWSAVLARSGRRPSTSMSMLPPAYPTAAAGTSAGAASSASAASAAAAHASATATATASSVEPQQPQPPVPLAFPAWDQPPQASYGWFVDVPPPRGPYLWPAVPDTYKLRSSSARSNSAEEEKSAVPPGEASNESTFKYAPQMVWGWFCAVPPPQPPYMWPALPEGYVLVRADEVDAAFLSPIPSSSGGFASAVQRQSSHVTSNPLGGSSTLPAPSAIPTTLPVSMLPSTTLGSPSFLSPSNFLASPMPPAMLSASSQPQMSQQSEQDQPMDTSDGPAAAAAPKKGKRGKANSPKK
jgi:hypothetical protein